MNPEYLENLQELARDEAAFVKLRQIFCPILTAYQQAQAQISCQTALLALIADALVAYDVNGNIIYFNYAAEILFGWQTAAVIGQNLLDIIVPNSEQELARTTFLHREYLSNICQQLSLQRRDRSQFLATVNQAVIQDESGNITGFVCKFVEIAPDKPRLAKVGDEVKWQTLVQNSPDIISVVEPDGILRFVSPSLETILGYKPAQKLGKNAFEVVHPDDITDVVNCFNDVIAHPTKSALITVRCRRQDGSWCCLESTVSNMLANPVVAGIVTQSRDISQRRNQSQELQQPYLRGGVMSDIDDRIPPSPNLEAILTSTVQEVQQVLECDRVLIYRFQPDYTGVVAVESHVPTSKPLLNTNALDPYIQPLISNYQHGEITAIADIYTANLDGSNFHLLAQLQVRAKLVVPILLEIDKNQPHLWGLLVAHQCRTMREWQEREINLVAALASQVALNIHQSKSLQTQQPALREQSLNRFMQVIRASLDLDTIFASAAQEISQLLHVDRVEIQQYLPIPQKWLTVVDYRQIADLPSHLGREIPDTDNTINRQLKQLEIVRIDDTTTVPAQVSPDLARTVKNRLLFVPLHFQNLLWGNLILTVSGRSYDWQDGEVELASAIATQLAIAIQQAQLYKQVSDLNIDLERQVQERTIELQQKIEELQQLNSLKDDFLSTVSHELRTPLANMKMSIQMLKVSSSPERSQRYLEILQAECNRETELINDLLDLQRLEASSYTLIPNDTINLYDWVLNIIEPFRSRLQERQQTIDVQLSPNLPPLTTDAGGLNRLITELLNNACKYTAANSEIVLHVYQIDEYITFTVSNPSEIPQPALTKIFDKFYRVPHADQWKQGGTGLGLALVQKLVQQLGGFIEVESAEGWTTFTVEVPVEGIENG